MSHAASGRVLEARVGDPTRKLILIGLADHAHADGTSAYIGVGLVAEYAECSVRTVQRHLAALIADGWIREGDQTEVTAHCPDARKRPISYDIAMTEQRRLQWAADAASGAGGRRAAAARAGAAGGAAAAAGKRGGVNVSPHTGEAAGPPRGDTGGLPGVTDPTAGGDTLGVTQTPDEPPVSEPPNPSAAAMFALPGTGPAAPLAVAATPPRPVEWDAADWVYERIGKSVGIMALRSLIKRRTKEGDSARAVALALVALYRSSRAINAQTLAQALDGTLVLGEDGKYRSPVAPAPRPDAQERRNAQIARDREIAAQLTGILGGNDPAALEGGTL